VPPEITLDNYRMILGLVRFHAEGQASKILSSMWNSLLVAAIVTVVNLLVGTTAGYAYARFAFPLKTLSLFALLFTRMLPTVVLIPAYFLVFRALGLQNSLSGLVLAYCSFTLPFTVWIMKAYFETIPADLDKSALVDGCNRWQACCRSRGQAWWPVARSRSCCAGTSSSSRRSSTRDPGPRRCLR